jgi:hypothetical protein
MLAIDTSIHLTSLLLPHSRPLSNQDTKKSSRNLPRKSHAKIPKEICREQKEKHAVNNVLGCRRKCEMGIHNYSETKFIIMRSWGGGEFHSRAVMTCLQIKNT